MVYYDIIDRATGQALETVKEDRIPDRREYFAGIGITIEATKRRQEGRSSRKRLKVATHREGINHRLLYDTSEASRGGSHG